MSGYDGAEVTTMDATLADARRSEYIGVATPHGEQDENGVDLGLIRSILLLSPTERIRRGDKARRDALRLREYGMRSREKRGGRDVPCAPLGSQG